MPAPSRALEHLLEGNAGLENLRHPGDHPIDDDLVTVLEKVTKKAFSPVFWGSLKREIQHEPGVPLLSRMGRFNTECEEGR